MAVAPGSAVYIEGLDEFRRVLRNAGKLHARELGIANKKVAGVYVDKAKPKVPRQRAGHLNLAEGIKAAARQRDITMRLRSTIDRPLVAAVLGADTHPVFGRRLPMEALKRRVWQPHLGNSWSPQDLYGIGDVFDDIPDEVAELWFEAIERAADGWLNG